MHVVLAVVVVARAAQKSVAFIIARGNQRIVAMSCCPQDILPINDGKTVEATFEILGPGLS